MGIKGNFEFISFNLKNCVFNAFYPVFSPFSLTNFCLSSPGCKIFMCVYFLGNKGAALSRFSLQPAGGALRGEEPWVGHAVLLPQMRYKQHQVPGR